MSCDYGNVIDRDRNSSINIMKLSYRRMLCGQDINILLIIFDKKACCWLEIVIFLIN